MNDAEPHNITIHCEIDGYPHQGQFAIGEIVIEFGRIENDHVQSTIRLKTPEHEFRTHCIFYGKDILEFVFFMEWLQNDLSGSVRLHDWDNEVVLCFTVIDSGRGHIVVGGQFLAAIHWTDIRSEDNFVGKPIYGSATGIKINFEGLRIDQSYLPGIIRDARRFLNETGISTVYIH